MEHEGNLRPFIRYLLETYYAQALIIGAGNKAEDKPEVRTVLVDFMLQGKRQSHGCIYDIS